MFPAVILLSIALLLLPTLSAVEKITIVVPPGKQRCIQKPFREMGVQKINYTLHEVGSMANYKAAPLGTEALFRVVITRVLSGGQVLSSGKGQGSYVWDITNSDNIYETYQVCFYNYMAAEGENLKFSLWMSNGVDMNDFDRIPLNFTSTPQIKLGEAMTILEAFVSHIPTLRQYFNNSFKTTDRGDRIVNLLWTIAAYGILFFLVASFIQTKLLEMRLVSKKTN